MYHARLTKLLEETAGRGGSESPSERDKATLDSIAEALGLSREQVQYIGTKAFLAESVERKTRKKWHLVLAVW